MLHDSDDIRLRMTNVGLHKVVRLQRDENPIGNKKDCLSRIDDNLWVSSDIHISRNFKRTEILLSQFNTKVDKDDAILFLGDLMDKHTGNKELVANFIKSLKCKNIYLVLGNNDIWYIHEYIDMGFKYVTDKLEFVYKDKKCIATHTPEPVTKLLNFHGHLHGSNTYWNMSPYNHIDVFDGDDGMPIIHQLKDFDIAKWESYKKGDEIINGNSI